MTRLLALTFTLALVYLLARRRLRNWWRPYHYDLSPDQRLHFT